PIVRRKSDLEPRYAVRIDGSLIDVLARRCRVVRTQKTVVKLLRRPVAALIESIFVVGAPGRDFLLRLLRKLNSCPVGQHLQGFAELAPLALHHKAEDIAAD